MNLREHMLQGCVIPAQPLALNAQRTLDEMHQKAITRYYVAAGSGGLAVGVHSTQFAIRDPQIGLYRPVLELASETIDASLSSDPRPFIKVAGICGRTEQAVSEADIARECGYHAGLLSLGAWKHASVDDLIAHCRAVADAIPVIGFYLQPAVGGRVLSYDFWRRFAEIENVLAIKIAPFNRYQTIDVVRAVAASGRDDIALYTGNDDNIIADLLTQFEFQVDGVQVQRRIVGGLLGQWAVWTHAAVRMLKELKEARAQKSVPGEWFTKAAQLTDANAVVFDAAHHFHGCIPGIHEVLRRQGLMAGTWCLDPDECLSPGQSEELDRVIAAYPWLIDDDFVAEHIDGWKK